MTTMISEVYDAFRSAGADEEKSRAAAQAIADYQRDISELKTELKQDISELKAELRQDIYELRSGYRLMQWMLTFNLTLTVAILWKVFS